MKSSHAFEIQQNSVLTQCCYSFKCQISWFLKAKYQFKMLQIILFLLKFNVMPSKCFQINKFFIRNYYTLIRTQKQSSNLKYMSSKEKTPMECNLEISRQATLPKGIQITWTNWTWGNLDFNYHLSTRIPRMTFLWCVDTRT